MRALLLTFLFCLALGATVRAEVTLDWWQFWTDPSVKPTITEMVREFEQLNPDIKVKLTDLTWANGHEKIVIAFASGSGPDVVELGSDWIAQFAADSHIVDLSDHVAADSAAFQGWSLATYQGGVFAKPWILGTRVIYYNRDLLKRAGYDRDFVPVGWMEFLSAATAINRLSSKVYGWGSNTAEKHRLYKKYMPFFWSARAKVLSENGEYCVVSSRYAVSALNFYKMLHDSCGYVADQRGIEDAFLDGKIGYIMSGDWLLKRIELEGHRLNFGTALMPGPNPNFGMNAMPAFNAKSTTYPGKSFLGGDFLAVNAASEHQAAAMKLIDFITTPENQLKFCKANRSANPSSRTAQTDEYFQSNQNLRTFVMQLALTAHPPVDPDWVFMEAEIEKAVEEALFGSRHPATALHRANLNITALRKK